MTYSHPDVALECSTCTRKDADAAILHSKLHCTHSLSLFFFGTLRESGLTIHEHNKMSVFRTTLQIRLPIGKQVLKELHHSLAERQPSPRWYLAKAGRRRSATHPNLSLVSGMFFVKTRHELVGLVCHFRRPLGNAMC